MTFRSISAQDRSRVHYIPVKGEINFGLAEFVHRGIREAAEAEAELIILGIDTMGGRVDACLEMVGYIRHASEKPIYAYVEDKSWSAGALIAFACERIIMREGSSIGSAAPVTGKGEDLGEKYVSALRAQFQATAEANGYPSSIAAAMVDKSLEVSRVEIDGRVEYLDQAQLRDRTSRGEVFNVIDTVSEEGKLLNLTYGRALEYGIASDVVSGIPDIAERYGFQMRDVVEVRKNWAEHMAIFFTNALMSSLLITLGMIFLYMELAEPGLGVPALLSLVCFGLFFAGRYIVNLAEWADIALFAVGVALIFLEIFVIPDFGISGILGGVMVLLSLYLALSPYRIPRAPWDFDTLRTTLLIILGSLTASIAGGFGMLNVLHRVPFLGRMVLDKEVPLNGREEFRAERPKLRPGDTGLALTALRPVGRVAFGDHVCDAVSQHGHIEKDEKVTIVEISDNRVLVKKEV